MGLFLHLPDFLLRYGLFFFMFAFAVVPLILTKYRGITTSLPIVAIVPVPFLLGLEWNEILRTAVPVDKNCLATKIKRHESMKVSIRYLNRKTRFS